MMMIFRNCATRPFATAKSRILYLYCVTSTFCSSSLTSTCTKCRVYHPCHQSYHQRTILIAKPSLKSPIINQTCHFCHMTTHRKSAVRLAYEVVGDCTNSTPIVVLHGLFGSKTNWATLIKKLHREIQRTVIAVDLRNHGSSEQAVGMSAEVMRDDLVMLLRKDLQVERCTLIGHSLGGRVSMVTALSEPDLIDKLVIVDVSPATTQGIFNFKDFLAAMKAVKFSQNLSLSENRKSAGKQLETVITSANLRHFILTNIIERDGCSQWRLGLENIDAGLCELTAPFPRFSTSYNGPVRFIRGSESSYVREEHLPAIHKLFPFATISTVERAGHFVHSEKPAEFLKVVTPFLKS